MNIIKRWIFQLSLYAILAIIVLCLIKLAFPEMNLWEKCIYIYACFPVSEGITRCIFKFLNEAKLKAKQSEPD